MKTVFLSLVLLCSFAFAFIGVRVSFDAGAAGAAEPLAATAVPPETSPVLTPPDVTVSATAATATIVPPPDPLDEPAAFYERLRAGGGWVVIALLALYGVLLAASKRVKALQQGRTAAIVAASLVLLLTLLDAISRGTPGLSAIAVAVAAGFALYLKTDVKPTEPAKAPTP